MSKTTPLSFGASDEELFKLCFNGANRLTEALEDIVAKKRRMEF
jgi:hypothetical protein